MDWATAAGRWAIEVLRGGWIAHLRPWVEVLSAAAAPVAALIGAYVAYQQWRTNRQRLRIELYDRRVAVFRGVREQVFAIGRLGRVGPDVLPEIVKACAEADFLFDPRLVTYLDQIYKRAIRMWALHAELEGLPAGEPRSKIVHEHAELEKWMAEQPTEMSGRFRKYLRVD